MIKNTLIALFTTAFFIIPSAYAEHKLKNGKVVPEAYFDVKAPSGLNLTEIYKVFELNVHDAVVEAVSRIAQSNEKMKELVDAKGKATNEISNKRLESEMLYVKKYRDRFVSTLSEVGIKPEQVANIGVPPANVKGALRGAALAIPKYLYQGEEVAAGLFNAKDPSGLNLPAIKADQTRRRGAGESNAFSFTVVAYASSKKAIDAKIKENKAPASAKAATDTQRAALEMGMVSNQKAMRAYGLSQEQINAIPALDDPRWGK